MRRLLLLTFVVTCFGTLAHAQEPAEQSPEIQVLGRWLGQWECQGEFQPAPWTPGGKHVTEIKTCAWALGGKFMEEHGTCEKPKREFRFIRGYDPGRERYRGWIFTSEGVASEMAGTWDEATKTMTWTWPAGEGMTGRVTAQFTSPDAYTQRGVVKDANGLVMMDFEAKHTRRRPGGR